MKTKRSRRRLLGVLCLLVLPLILTAQTSESILTTEVPATYTNDAVYELGTRFKATSEGQITAVRIYTNNLEGGDHTVRIWNLAGGTVIAGPYTWNITAGTEGWKVFTLPSPLNVVPGEDYTVSVSTSTDQWYSSTANGFAAPINSSHLRTYVASGVYSTALNSMPVNVSGNRNYFRDVIFVSSDTTGGNNADSNGVSIWPDVVVPAHADANDNASVELGMKFKPSVNGKVTGVRYYKSAANNGNHTGSLWSADGVLLAQAVFTNETATGWQRVSFSEPVFVKADKTYVVSYHTNAGHYAYDYHYFDSAHVSGDLTALASPASGGNGVFHYGPSVTFPTATSSATNYWVDLTFVPGGLDSSAVSLWPLSTVPSVTGADEGAALELGVKFKADTIGRVTGVRFYKGIANTGIHTGSLWSADGTLLRQGIFKAESASGWQELSFAKPFKITSGTTYVVSYHTNSGHYAYDYHYFDSAHVNGKLTAWDNSTVNGNGVFKYGQAIAFPDGSSNASNYWVDITFAPGKAEDSLAPSRPLNLQVSATIATTVSLSWSHSTDNIGVTGYQVYRNGSATPLATVTTDNYTDTTLTPGSTYTYVIYAVDDAENVSEPSNTVSVATTAVSTAVNRALQFDGVDDCIALYNNQEFPQGDFTFEAWVKVAPGTVGTIYGNYDPVKFRISQHEVLFHTKLGSVSTVTTEDNAANWVYLAITRQGSLLSGYRNGVLFDTTTLAPGNVDFTLAGIGGVPQDGGTSTQNFKGAIDEIRISNAARAVAEIQANWNNGNGALLRSDDVTAALWHFNEGKGAILYDYSRYGHEGQLRPAFGVNTPDWVAGKVISGTIGDFSVYTPDFHSRLGIRPLVAVTGVAAGDKFKASLDGVAVFAQDGPLPVKLRFPVDLRALAQGDHVLTWELKAADGSLIKRDSTVFHKSISGIPRSGIDEDNAPCVDGVRIPFVFAPFIANKDWVEEPDAGWLSHTPMAINTFFSKGYTFPSPDFTRWAWDEHQLYGIQGDDTANIPAYVDSLKDLPGLLMYNWYDEPDLAGVKPPVVRSWTQATHDLDPQHPVVVNLQGASAEREDALYWMHSARSYFYPTHAADVRMFDYYPRAMAWPSVENITYEKALANLAVACDNYHYWTYDQEPVWSFVQPDQFSGSSAPAPSVAELRINYWVNIIHGVKGIGWFTHFFPTPDSNFAEMSRLVDKTIRLTDVIYSPEVENAVSKQELNGGRIDISTKVHDGKIYVFAANMKNAAQDARFTLNIPATGNAATVFDEQRSIPLPGTTFTDHFEPYAVHIYVIQDSTTQNIVKGSSPQLANNIAVQDEITCYPNPFSSGVRISTNAGLTINSIDVYDSEGKLVQTLKHLKQEGNTLNIALEHFSRGVYLLQFHTNKGIKTQKLIKL